MEHLIRTGSDHAPLLMICGANTTHLVKPFRFLNFWIKHETFKDVVFQNWVANFIRDPLWIFKQKFRMVKIALSKWSKLAYGDILKQLAIKEDIVKIKEILFEEEPTIDNKIILQKAQAELKRYLNIEEQYWKQKAGMTWFAEGDRNTRFFHNHVNGKRRKLKLNRIHNGDGVWIETQDLLDKEAVDFFQNKFSHEGDPTSFDLLSNVPSMIISRVMHDRLEKIFPPLISSNQSGFVKGRTIFENMLLTQEIVTDIRLRGKPANVVIKLDMAKAYDRVS
ncbi:uncharacterized protein LOC142178123 [Nicotiana tabacum]|uniref:Uncharacterized protein LOC142178123 n=1 Tax=Nicotiana tabacum TaxID=4097 RepID=A0AC58U272_TOBAC